MKKAIFIGMLFMALGLVSAQAQSGIKLGGHVGYATDISSIGFGIDGVYDINEKFSAAANFTYYPESDFLTWSSIDLNAHYNLGDTDGLNYYALGGIDILMVKFEADLGMFGTVKTSDTNIGLNLGGGSTYSLSDKFDLFGEARYTVGNANYMNFRAGVLYKL
jgi:Outer membrane protein beta-barrel domain